VLLLTTGHSKITPHQKVWNLRWMWSKGKCEENGKQK
jgi:hypothetical protein